MHPGPRVKLPTPQRESTRTVYGHPTIELINHQLRDRAFLRHVSRRYHYDPYDLEVLCRFAHDLTLTAYR
jgi:hypothetical protein